RPGLLFDVLVDRHVSLPGYFHGGAGIQPAGRRVARPFRSPPAEGMMAAADANSAAHLLEVRDLQVEFAVEGGTVTAVDGVSFHIHPGEQRVGAGEAG